MGHLPVPSRRSLLKGALVSPALVAVKPEQPRTYYWIHRHPAPCGDSWSVLLRGCDVTIYHHKPGSGYAALQWSNKFQTKTWDGEVADYERICRTCFP